MKQCVVYKVVIVGREKNNKNDNGNELSREKKAEGELPFFC